MAAAGRGGAAGRVRARRRDRSSLYGIHGAELTVRKRVRAHGRVQGVFFRDSVRREAERRGVAGWASNEPDGTVRAVFEGAARRRRRARRLLPRRVPATPSVERLDVTEEEPEGLSGFSVG